MLSLFWFYYTGEEVKDLLIYEGVMRGKKKIISSFFYKKPHMLYRKVFY